MDDSKPDGKTQALCEAYRVLREDSMDDSNPDGKTRALCEAHRVLREIRHAISGAEGAGIMYSSRKPIRKEWIAIIYKMSSSSEATIFSRLVLDWLDPNLPSAQDILRYLRKQTK